MSPISAKMLINNRLLAILVLGFSSGLPLALTYSTLQAWFTNEHINIVAIGSLSLIGLPYTLKFLWAPLMDHYSLSWLGRRGWIIYMQLAVALSLALLANMDPSLEAGKMALIALAVAFFSASQDIAIDAYRTTILKPDERGLGAAYFVFAYRVAMLVSGGLALIFADYFGWKITYLLMAILILLSMLPTYFAPNTLEYHSVSPTLFGTIKESFLDLLQREKVVLLLLFIVFYKFGDAFAVSLMTNFLLKGLGFSLIEVGTAYKIVSFVAMILGGFVGGLILTRWHVYYALLLFGLAQSFSNLTFVVLALAGKQFFLMAGSIFIENFCSGLSTAAFFAFLMSLCNAKYAAGQFALLSAIASLGRVFLGPIAGLVVQNVGWVQFYIWSFILCLPGILLLVLLKDKVFIHAEAAAD